MLRISHDVCPFVRVFPHVVQFFRAVGIVNVAPMLTAHAVIVLIYENGKANWEGEDIGADDPMIPPEQRALLVADTAGGMVCLLMRRMRLPKAIMLVMVSSL